MEPISGRGVLGFSWCSITDKAEGGSGDACMVYSVIPL